MSMDEMETAINAAEEAARRLFGISRDDELIELWHGFGRDAIWETLKERFGKECDWQHEPLRARAMIWSNFAATMNARADELTSIPA